MNAVPADAAVAAVAAVSAAPAAADPSAATARPDATDTDVAVIGAGPVGLWQWFQLGLLGLRVQVVDALPQPGGQCTALYAGKPIHDIPGAPGISAAELVQRLLAQAAPFAPALRLGCSVDTLNADGPGAGSGTAGGRLVLGLSDGTRLRARAVVVAAGVGAFAPRRLKLPGLDAFEGRQLFHDADTMAEHAGAPGQVVVAGGGEEALETVLALAQAASATGATDATGPRPAPVLLHRRAVFDAPQPLLARLQAQADAGKVRVVVGQPVGWVETGGRLQALRVATDGGETLLPLDTLLVRQGLSPRLGPLADWGLALERRQVVVDPASFATAVDGVHAVGDVVAYPGKLKLIACGFHEATMAAWAIARRLAGGDIGPVQYTTTSRLLQQRLGLEPPAPPAPPAPLR